MELSPSKKEVIRKQFDSFCKKVLKYEARNYHKGTIRQLKYEISFSELSQQEMNQLYTMDEYNYYEYIFNVLGYSIEVKDELIVEALKILPEQKRDIILLSYFLDMTDKEIGEQLNLVRRTVQYQRTSSLKQLRKYLEGKTNDETKWIEVL